MILNTIYVGASEKRNTMLSFENKDIFEIYLNTKDHLFLAYQVSTENKFLGS